MSDEYHCTASTYSQSNMHISKHCELKKLSVVLVQLHPLDIISTSNSLPQIGQYDSVRFFVFNECISEYSDVLQLLHLASLEILLICNINVIPSTTDIKENNRYFMSFSNGRHIITAIIPINIDNQININFIVFIFVLPYAILILSIIDITQRPPMHDMKRAYWQKDDLQTLDQTQQK